MTKHDWRWVAGLALLAALAGCARRQQPTERFDASSVDVLRTAFGSAVKGPAGPKAAIPDPDGWATLKGTFKLVGQPPARKPLDVNRDHSVCAPGGKPVLGEDLVIDTATNGIKDVAIYLIGPHPKFPVGDSKWEHESYGKTAGNELLFDQKQCVFLTHLLAIRSSQKVRVTNSDPVGHNTNINGIGGAKSESITVPEHGYSMYQPGGQSPRPFKVICNIHPWMGAMMLVRDSPYFAVSKADGSFEIPNLPSGVELEFQVFQEAAKNYKELTVNGKPVTWEQGKFKIKLPKDQTETLNVEIKSAAFGA